MLGKTEHTFVVLAHGTSPHLGMCVGSLLNQSAKSHLVISTSTPNEHIVKIANKFNIQLHVNNEKRSIANDWNNAFNLVKTPYLTLAHQDDIYMPGYTETLLRIIKQSNSALIGFSDYYEEFYGQERYKSLNLVIKRLINSICFAFSGSMTSNAFKRLYLSFGSPICCPSVMYNKERLSDFKFNELFFIDLDWEAWYQIANRAGSFVYIDKMLVMHRIHSNTATTAGILNGQRQGEDLAMFRKFWPTIIAKVIARLYTYCLAENKWRASNDPQE